MTVRWPEVGRKWEGCNGPGFFYEDITEGLQKRPLRIFLFYTWRSTVKIIHSVFINRCDVFDLLNIDRTIYNL